MKRLLTVSKERARLDSFIAAEIPSISRAKVRALIESGKVLVNGRIEKPGHRVAPGQEIVLEIPELKDERIEPRHIPLDIIYEDGHIIVVNKPAGMVTHPAETVKENTLVNALLGHTDRLSDINGPARRGIIHRLDKDTTGALIIAKTNEAHISLSEQISARTVKRNYRALVIGGVEPEKGEINAPLGRHDKRRVKMAVKYLDGRDALTLYEVDRKFRVGGDIFSYLKISLKTGRTHQIRVHFSSIGHPVCGDPKYGKKSPHISMVRQALHAEEVRFIHPATGERVKFKARQPEDFRLQLEALEAAAN